GGTASWRGHTVPRATSRPASCATGTGSPSTALPRTRERADAWQTLETWPCNYPSWCGRSSALELRELVAGPLRDRILVRRVGDRLAVRLDGLRGVAAGPARVAGQHPRQPDGAVGHADRDGGAERRFRPLEIAGRQGRAPRVDLAA